MTSIGKEYTCILLAIINIKKEMGALGSQERVAVAKMCNEVVTKKTAKDAECIEWIEDGSMGVQIIISPEAVQVHCEEYLVSHFKMDDIGVMMSFPKSEANLVIVGQCSKKRKPVGLVFDLLSDQQAEQCIQAIAKAAVKENNTSS